VPASSAARARAWGWRETAEVALVVSAPLLAFPLFRPGVTDAAELARASGLIAYIVALASSLLLYLHWRMTGGGPLAWLVAGLTALSLQGLAMSGLVAADPERADSHPALTLVTQVVITAGILAVVWAARFRFKVDPMTIGIPVGVALFALRFVLVGSTDPMTVSDRTVDLLSFGVLALDVAVAVAVFRFERAPRWVRAWLALALLILGAGHASAYPVPDGTDLSILTIALNVVGSTILCCLAVALVRLSIRDNRTALAFLRDQLATAEAGLRADRARLHEIRATIAGISSAARVVHQSSAVAPVRRQQIQQMMNTEIGRLERLMNDRDSGDPVLINLDSTIEPVVVRHRTRGYPINWTPSGLRAIGRADDVAEVINVLLENAFRHAPNAQAWIEMRQVGECAEIAVRDSGPGVARDLRDRIFDWGESGPDSPGEGIGLNVARELSSDLGGQLRLVDSAAPGACFVLSLPTDLEPS
jgi:signal transduction histidine kinase